MYRQDQFYLTLPSNSSMNYFPNNTSANFTTHLPHPISLDGSWEVALDEIHYPCSLLTVSEQSAIYIYIYEKTRVARDVNGKREKEKEKAPAAATTELIEPIVLENVEEETTSPPPPLPTAAALTQPETKPSIGSLLSLALDKATSGSMEAEEEEESDTSRFVDTVGGDEVVAASVVEEEEAPVIFKVPRTIIVPIPTGNYVSPENLVRTINSQENIQKYVTFTYDDSTKKVYIAKVAEGVDIYRIDMSSKLALQMGYEPNENYLDQNEIGIRPTNLLLGLPSHMYVYCNIVEPQFTGDTFAPLLRMINIRTLDYVYGTNVNIQVHRPHYVPLSKTTFGDLEIDLRDDLGNPLKFLFGTTCIKLHFRRRA